MLSLDSPEVIENGSSILWHTMVRPQGEVILCHLTRGPALTGMLKIIKNKKHVNYCDSKFSMYIMALNCLKQLLKAKISSL